MIDLVHTVIIGAGPAGLNAARFIEKECIILEVKSEIGVPVRCGEGVSLHALVREGLTPQKTWIANEARAVKVVVPSGKAIGERGQTPCAFTIRRNLFDKYLAGLVSHPIHLNTRVTDILQDPDRKRWIIRTSRGRKYAARYVIGADGPHSLVARRVFHKKNQVVAGIGYESVFERPFDVTDELRMYFGNDIAPKGYGWVFPLSERTANLGLFTRENQTRARQYFERFLENIVIPAYGGCRLTKRKTGALPTGGFYDQLVKDRALLVGDAGGFTDPIFEGGLNTALLTGRYAGEAVNLERPSLYQERIDALPFTRQELLTAREILYGFDDDTLNELGEIMEDRGPKDARSPRTLLRLASRSNAMRQSRRLYDLLKIWSRAEDYLW